MSGEPCEIRLQGGLFRPGDTINGSVICNFETETKAKGIKVRFKGRAKVSWHENRTSHKSDQTFFDMESEMLADETTFPPGQYGYPFSFSLPSYLPSSLEDEVGTIRYTIKAVVDRPWAIDYTAAKGFIIENVWDLNRSSSVRQAMEFKKKKFPFSLKSDVQPITLSVQLPFTGYVPSQMVSFKAKVVNESHANVKAAHFQLAQGFHFHTQFQDKTVTSVTSEEYAVINGAVPSGTEKSWDLQIRVPSNVLSGIYEPCEIIKPFFELRCEVMLSLFHSNLRLLIPLSLGSVALDTTDET